MHQVTSARTSRGANTCSQGIAVTREPCTSIGTPWARAYPRATLREGVRVRSAPASRDDDDAICTTLHWRSLLPEGRFVIELAPNRRSRDGHAAVLWGARRFEIAGHLRLFRYEIRRWRNGVIPDLAAAVSTVRLTDGFAVAPRPRPRSVRSGVGLGPGPAARGRHVDLQLRDLGCWSVPERTSATSTHRAGACARLGGGHRRRASAGGLGPLRWPTDGPSGAGRTTLGRHDRPPETGSTDGRRKP